MSLTFEDIIPIGCHAVTGGTDVYTCPAGKRALVENMQVANVDGIADADVSASRYQAGDSGTYFIAKTVAVPADAALQPKGERGKMWLSAGDKLNVVASADGDLDFTADVILYGLS